jgi:hypothetical protein
MGSRNERVRRLAGAIGRFNTFVPSLADERAIKHHQTLMFKTTPEQNKALVLEAFETLFNKRDYAVAERFWSHRYIQHSAHIATGRDGLFNPIRTLPTR